MPICKSMTEETDQGQREDILRAHRNFLRDAVYFLYENNRMAEAAKWFKYLGEKYPDEPIIEKRPDSLPKNLTLDEYAVAVVQIDIGETSQERVTSAVHGIAGARVCGPGHRAGRPRRRLPVARPKSL